MNHIQAAAADSPELRILHIDSTLDSGGIATSLWHLLPAQREILSPRKCVVSTAVLYDVGLYGKLLIKDGIPVHDLQFGHKYSPRGFWRLFRLLNQNRYDIIHAHGWPAVFFVALISLVNRRPRHILSEHNVTNRRRRWGLKLLDRFIYWRFDAVPAVSRAAATALIAWLPETKEKVHVVYNGLDVGRLYVQAGTEQSGRFHNERFERSNYGAENGGRQELDVPEDTPLVFAAGSLEHRKGIDVLLQALALIEGPRPMTLIAGDGPLRPDLERRAQELGVATRVRFLGFRPDLPMIMITADLFVLSSRWEGCPMVVLEAMALARPIVATAVGGVPELLLDGRSGRLVPAESPEALSESIQQMLADPAALTEMGNQAHQRLLACFQVERSARQMLRIYLDEAGSEWENPDCEAGDGN